MGLRQRVPWWAKMGAKIALSRIPVPYSLWRALGVFRHGDMHDPEHAFSVFKAHLDRALAYWPVRPGFTCLELGPGDSLLSGVVARAFGASRVYMVDSGDYAIKHVSPYRRLAALLHVRGMAVPEAERCSSIEELEQTCGIIYLNNGTRSLAEIEDGSIDYFWSQVVLEHVPRHEFPVLLRELRRIVCDSAVGSHSVDLRDHRGGALNSLRFSERAWESSFMSRSGFYTNRIRFRAMLEMFRGAGFDAHVVKAIRWEALPTPQHSLAEPYHSMDADDLRVAEFEVVMWPSAGEAEAKCTSRA